MRVEKVRRGKQSLHTLAVAGRVQRPSWKSKWLTSQATTWVEKELPSGDFLTRSAPSLRELNQAEGTEGKVWPSSKPRLLSRSMAFAGRTTFLRSSTHQRSVYLYASCAQLLPTQRSYSL